MFSLNSSLRGPAKPQIQLGQSQALKKFEKFQAKFNSSKEKKGKKGYKYDEDDDEDEDSFYKNMPKNKFVKQKEKEKKSESEKTLESDDSDLEITLDHSSTPIPSRIANVEKSIRSRSRLLSASSASSLKSPTRRPQSKVKFVHPNDSDQDLDEELSISEHIMGKNLILNIDDLESASVSKSPRKKSSPRKKPKSPISSRRTQSVASIIDENEESIKTDSSDSKIESIFNSNLILDINEYEKSISRTEKKKSLKSESEHSIKKKDKTKKSSFKRKETPSLLDKSIASSVHTEVSSSDESERTRREKKSTARSGYESSRTEKSRRNRHSTKISEKTYYQDDFDTERDLTPKRKDYSYNKRNKPISTKRTTVETTNAEIQCDPVDLLKNSDFAKTISVFNPSSIVLANTFLNNSSSLKELNELTGYTLFNQAFNDLIKINVNFVKNFLATQRALYEQQIKSIQPREFPIDFLNIKID